MSDKDKKDNLINELKKQTHELKKDIYVHEKLQEHLITSKKEWEQTFDAMPDMIAVIDNQHMIIKANRAMAQKLGMEREHLIGMRCYSALHGTEAPSPYCPHHKTQTSGGDHFVESYDEYLKGYFYFSCTPVCDSDGRCIGAVEVIRDMTLHKAAEESLRKSEQRFRDIAENSLEWIWEVDATGKYTYASPVVEKILGYKPEEILGKYFYDLFHSDDREQLKRGAFEVFAAKQSFREFINRNVHKNGSTVWLSTSGIPILDEAGKLLGYRGADADITHRKRYEEDIMQREAMAKAISDSSMDAIIVIDGKGIITYFNHAAEKIFHYSPEEVIGRDLHSFLVSKKAKEQYYRKLPDFEKTGTCVVVGKTLEVYGTRKNGTRFPVEISISSFQLNGLWHSAGTIRDITARKKLEEKLLTTSITDELTGLLNRRGFFTFAEKQFDLAKRNMRNLSILFLDLNNLKDINDTFGHTAGDQALIDISLVLRHSFRASDVIARMGGDEFAVILIEPKKKDIEKIVSDNMKKNIEAHNEKAGILHPLSVSIGFAHFDPEHPATIDELLARADAAMYADKQRQKLEKK